MQTVYDSDSYVVVAIDVATPGLVESATEPLSHGGYEIVDKFARREIFLQGAMAEHFKQGVEALIETKPSEEEIDDFLSQFTSMAQQPVILH